jgi:hypothetical protein
VVGPVTEPSYIQALHRAEPEARYQTYLELRTAFRDQRDFYLDCGAFFLGTRDRLTGLRIASNILDLEPGDPFTLLSAAGFYQSNAAWSPAIDLFGRLADTEPNRAHAFRELALTHVLRGLVWEAAQLRTRARDDLTRARLLYRQIIDAAWSAGLEEGKRRFDGIELLALAEYHWTGIELNRLGEPPTQQALDPGLTGSVTADLRVVLSWEEPNADIDLLVTEPPAGTAAEEGGHAGPDHQRGPGPEHFTVAHAREGRYLLAARCHSGPTSPVIVKLTVFRGFAGPDEAIQIIRREVQPGTTALLKILDFR